MVSLRLPASLEKKLIQAAKNEQVSKSEVVKRALALYFRESSGNASPFELGKDLFGRFGSGTENLSRDYKRILKEKLREKYNH